MNPETSETNPVKPRIPAEPDLSGMSGPADQMRRMIAELDLSGATHDQVLGAIDVADVLSQVAKELRSTVRDQAVEWIQEHGQDLVVSDTVRYRAGVEKTTKCRDARDIIEPLLVAVGGDLDALAGCLSSSAFLPGACRKLLPADQFEQLFETSERVKLKEGKPRKQLIKADDRFKR